jgi:hypothetical protein
MTSVQRVLVWFVTPAATANLQQRILSPLLAGALAVVAVLWASAASAESMEIDWIRQFGSAGPANDFAQAVDSDGNVYVAGETGGTLPGLTSAGVSDAFIRKYDADGNQVWTRQFGSSSLDVALGIAADTSGVYVAGRTNGTLPGQTSAGESDAFVRKYDANGTEVWTRQFGSASSEEATAVAVDASGVYVAGRTFGTLPGQTSAGESDAFVRKYDVDGNQVWTRQFGTSSVDVASGIAADTSGVYVAGRTGGTLPGQTSARFDDAFVRKYDADGNEVWTRQFGSSNFDLAMGIAVDASGVYVAGETRGALPGQTSSGSGDAFVRKYDASGNEVWTRQFGTSSFDLASGVAVDASGVYVAGQTLATLPGQTSAGSSDAFIRKYDTDGLEVWTRQFGSSFHDAANGVAVDFSGVYAAGRTDGVLPGQTSAGAADVFVRKYDGNGTEVWTRQFGGPGPAEDLAQAVDSDGNVYVAGATAGTLPGQTSAGSGDAFVRKYDADGNELWTRQFGSSSTDQAIGVASDASGVYVVGRTEGALPGQTHAGSPDAFIRKYDTSGAEMWTRQFGTSHFDLASGVAADTSGVYVVGLTDGALSDQTSAGASDAFVRKYDASGNEVWTRQFGSPSFDSALGIGVDASGVYVTGRARDTLPGQTSAGADDAFVRKYDTSGSEVWTRQFGTSGVDAANAVSMDASGVYVAGLTTGTLPGQTSAGGQDAFIRKYDASGTEAWTRQFGTSGLESANSVAVNDSEVYVSGSTNGTLPGQASAGGSDALIRKYDASGNEGWTLQFGTSGFDAANGVAADASGVYVSGLTSGTLPGQTSSGGTDAFVAKFSGPTVESISAPSDPVLVETEITVSGTFSNTDALDTHTAVWDWDDGSTSTGTVVESGGSGTVSGTHTYTSPGVYTLKLTVTDDDGASDSAVFEYVVVYDPEGGFVTGAGSFDSPAGAYTADPALTGRARFGFVSKYQKGATIPTGETQFDFRVANFSFRSTSYEWLVVSGAKAQYKGSGTINGAGDYGFLLTATDGEVNGGGGQDKFRIKMWDKATGAVIYDNQKGDADDAETTTVISGSIMIHK